VAGPSTPLLVSSPRSFRQPVPNSSTCRPEKNAALIWAHSSRRGGRWRFRHDSAYALTRSMIDRAVQADKRPRLPGHRPAVGRHVGTLAGAAVKRWAMRSTIYSSNIVGPVVRDAANCSQVSHQFISLRNLKKHLLFFSGMVTSWLGSTARDCQPRIPSNISTQRHSGERTATSVPSDTFGRPNPKSDTITLLPAHHPPMAASQFG
jgi:hypothetical protein